MSPPSPISPILPRSSSAATSSPRIPASGPARLQVPAALDVSRISSSLRSALAAPLARLTRSPTNTSSSSSPFCRICHDLSKSESLISPCRCSGSCGLIHKTCLERWLSASAATNPSSCEICGHAFAVEKRPGTFGQWLCRRTRPLDNDHRNLCADLACFLLLTPLAAASAFLCGTSANYYVAHRQPVGAFGMAFLSTFLFAVYLIWITLTLRFHYEAWTAWRTSHHAVKLVQVKVEEDKKKGASSDMSGIHI